jgi:hypothetical protein
LVRVAGIATDVFANVSMSTAPWLGPEPTRPAESDEFEPSAVPAGWIFIFLKRE